MIFGVFLAVEDDDISSESHRSRGHHFSKREAGCLLVILLIVIVVSGPMVGQLKAKSEDTACRANLKEIGNAVLLYSEQNDGRLPPVYNMNADGTPALVPEGIGHPVTWATQVEGMLSKRASFLCRSATEAETVTSISGLESEKSFPLSYGMYRGLSTSPRIQIPDPATAILVADSSNGGAERTYDPTPFGPNQPDGFLIGWDDNNLEFTKASKWATRLAFHNASSGYDGATVVPRHPEHINAINVDGALRMLHPYDAKIEHDAARLKGRWWADPNLFH